MSEFKDREYQHFQEAGLSLGVDIENGYARVTVAAVNRAHGDNFSKSVARKVMDLRFDEKNDAFLSASNFQRCVTRFPYNGDKPIKEILKPLQENLSEKIEYRRKNEEDDLFSFNSIVGSIRKFSHNVWKNGLPKSEEAETASKESLTV